MPTIDRWPLVLLTLLLGIVCTATAWHYSYSMESKQLEGKFQLEAEAMEKAIVERFHDYQQVLRSGIALFSASQTVTREEWKHFTDLLGTNELYPGIQGIGFAQQLTHAETEQHTERIRAEGYPDYTVHPIDPKQPPTSIVYIEPFDFRNQRAFGYNMYSNPVRRAAMQRARDTGLAALSGRVTLVQETGVDPQAGTLLYLPLYAENRPLKSMEQRRQALIGWVYSPFRMKDLMQGILGQNLSGLSLQIHDGLQPDPKSMLYSSLDSETASSIQPPRFTQQRILNLAGHNWLVRVSSQPGYGEGLISVPHAILLGGCLLTLLMCGLAATLGRAEARARTLARNMTSALRHSEERQTAILQNVADGILTIDSDCILQSFNAAAESMFGYKASEVIGRNVTVLMPERYREGHDAKVASLGKDIDPRSIAMRREVVGKRNNGEEFPIWMSVNRMPAANGWEFVAMLSDISESKETQRQLAEANRLRESILESSPFAIISTDAEGLIQSLNPAAVHLLGYRAEELIDKQSACVLHDEEELEQHAREINQHREQPLPCGIDSLLARVREGQTEEREWNYIRKDGSTFPVDATINALHDHDNRLAGYLIIAYDITDRRKTQAFIEHMAHHDALTDLPNRILMHDRLDQAITQAGRDQSKVAVIMMDLDNFKRINDSLGHHIGDELLLAIARRLKTVLRKGDTVARMGGDEFVLVLPDVLSREGVGNIADKIIDTISQPMRVQKHELTITPSLGICLFPTDGDNSHNLLKNADTAMYQAKAAGRGTYRFFQPCMLHLNQERLDIENAMRKAFAEDQFTLQYQPQIRLMDGKLVGSEALIRWEHPELGKIPPNRFIPIAEEMGLIRDLGNWVMHRACQDLREIQDNLDMPRLSVAVNISPQQFFHDDLADSVLLALSDAQLPPECLEIEITEGTLLENSEKTLKQLKTIRSLGVRVAIDDFGTGYSSLSYITRFPIDKLKIDQSFIRDITHDPNDAAITSAIIVMAHTLQLSVVAEGVENTSQLAFLQRRRCDIAQGFYYSPSMTPAAFTKFARHRLHTLAKPMSVLSESSGTFETESADTTTTQ